MSKIPAALLIAFGLAQAAAAAEPGCTERADAKHLAGAARNSFLAKCERTEKATAATAQCNTQADDKKLHGAARNSFVKKCVSTAGK